jgi:hypothetical protein
MPGRKGVGGLPRWSRGFGFILHESVEEIDVAFVRLAAVGNDLVHVGLDVEHRLFTAAATVEEDLHRDRKRSVSDMPMGSRGTSRWS